MEGRAAQSCARYVHACSGIADEGQAILSGRSRNLERGVQSPARFARRKFLGCHAHFRSRERIQNKI